MDKKDSQQKEDPKKDQQPPTPSQAEGDERTVDQALKNQQSKPQK